MLAVCRSLLILWVFAFTIFGTFVLIELTSRELELADLKQDLAQLDQEILHGLQELQEVENLSTTSKEPLFKTLRIRTDLFNRKVKVRKQLERLKTEISGLQEVENLSTTSKSSSKAEESRWQSWFSENWFSKFSSNTLLVPLIVLTAFTGAVVHILRVKEEKIALPFVSGLGVGIFCLLFLTSGADAINSAFGIFPSLNVSVVFQLCCISLFKCLQIHNG